MSRKKSIKLAVTNSLGELIPGPTGPIGKVGPLPAPPLRRILKVQLVDDVPVPAFIQGFSWENEVAEPPDWPVAGTFIFYKATVLDQDIYSVAETFNVNGGSTHSNTTADHQAVVAHYRNGTLLDMHAASSRTVGVQDSLLAQTLHDVLINDCLYFAISPDISSLINFNYNLGSLQTTPSFKIPEDTVDGILLPGSLGAAGQTFIGYVTVDTSITIFVGGSFRGVGAGEARDVATYGLNW